MTNFGHVDVTIIPSCFFLVFYSVAIQDTSVRWHAVSVGNRDPTCMLACRTCFNVDQKIDQKFPEIVD